MKRRLIHVLSAMLAIALILAASGCSTSATTAQATMPTLAPDHPNPGVISVDTSADGRRGARDHVKLVAIDGEPVPNKAQAVSVAPGVHRVTVEPTWSNYAKPRQTMQLVVRPGKTYVVRCAEETDPTRLESLGTAATVATGLFVVTEPIKALAGADAPPATSTCYLWVADAYSNYTVAGVNPATR